MASDSRKRLWRIAGLGLILIGGLYFLTKLFSDEQKTFPALKTGAYAGQISGIGAAANQSHSFYIERLANSSALLVVLLADGWKPQVVQMIRRFSSVEASGKTLTDDIALEPLVINQAGVIYQLSGEGSGGQFAGELIASNGAQGSWDLRSISPTTLSQGQSIVAEDAFNFREWLIVKAQHLSIQEEYEIAQQLVFDFKEKQDRLLHFVADEENLRKRSQERKQELRAELEKLQAARKESSKTVKRLVSELDLLGRITKQGKVVTLARRVASREAKWYQANWRAEEDTSGLEEFLSTSARLNLSQLDTKYAQAVEKRTLQLELAAEQRRIRELQAPKRAVESAPPQEAETGAGTQKPGMWDRLWGRIK